MSRTYECDRCHQKSPLLEFLSNISIRTLFCGREEDRWWSQADIDLCRRCQADLDNARGQAEADFYKKMYAPREG